MFTPAKKLLSQVSLDADRPIFASIATQYGESLEYLPNEQKRALIAEIGLRIMEKGNKAIDASLLRSVDSLSDVGQLDLLIAVSERLRT